jgi:protein SCO1/2
MPDASLLRKRGEAGRILRSEVRVKIRLSFGGNWRRGLFSPEVVALGVVVAVFAVTAPCGAQQEQPLGAAAPAAPAYLKKAGIAQNLNGPLPLSDHFQDESGKDVILGQYFGKLPVVVALVYYKCSGMCPEVLHGAASALSQTGLHAGTDYNVVVASIDPTDTPADSVGAKLQFISMLGGSIETADYVHFLTGKQASIDDLAAATGFHYVKVPGPDGKLDQFAHSSVIMFATPDGRMSKYLSGISYQPRDVRLALIEAGNRRIATATDLVLLYCTHYSPSQGRYTVSVLRILGLAGVVSVFAVVGMLYLLSRKPKERPVLK